MALQKICIALLFLTLDMTCHKTNCQEMKMAGNETALQQKLFSDYNKFRKPVRMFSDRVPVWIQLYPLSIQKLDMRSQTLQSAIWFEIEWMDEYLTWNSRDFDNIQCLRLPATQVWVPSICNVKEISGKRCINFGSVMHAGNEVKICSIRHVILQEPLKSIVSCWCDVSKFPFNSQKCVFYYISPNEYSHSVKILSNLSSFDIQYLVPNEEWDVVSTSVDMEGLQIYMTIVLRRRPMFTFISVVLPIVVLSVMNTFCYVLPIESGEKIGMSVAIFLTFAVFGSILSDTMPRNSENISWFIVYVTTQIVLSGSTVVMETIVLRMYHREGMSLSHKTESTVCNSKNTSSGIEEKRKNQSCDPNFNWKRRAKMLDKVFLIFNIFLNIICVSIFTYFVLS